MGRGATGGYDSAVPGLFRLEKYAERLFFFFHVGVPVTAVDPVTPVAPDMLETHRKQVELRLRNSFPGHQTD